MSAIRSLLRPLIPIFPKLEQYLLDYVVEHTPDPQIKEALRRRVRSINRAFHYPDWKETEMRRAFFGKRFRSRGSATPAPLTQWLFCTLSFKVSGVPDAFRAKFWLVNNYLFSIEYSKSIKEFRNAVPEVTKIEYNLPKPISASVPGETLSREQLVELLGPWANDIGITEIKSTEAPEIREEVLKQIEIPLPGDYLSLIAKCGGFSTTAATVLGVSELQTIPGKNRLYCVLAELAEAHFLVSTDQQELLRINYEEVIFKKFNGGFVDALRESLTSKD